MYILAVGFYRISRTYVYKKIFSVRLLSVCVVIPFFHPRQNGQWPPTSKDFYTRSYLLHFFLILILEKESVFPFSILSAKQGHYWYHFYNVFGITRSLTGDWTRTSRTRSQHSTTRLSMRRYNICIWYVSKLIPESHDERLYLSSYFRPCLLVNSVSCQIDWVCLDIQMYQKVYWYLSRATKMFQFKVSVPESTCGLTYDRV